MKLSISLSLDNAAFEDYGVSEVERILSDLCSRLPDPLDQTGGELNLYDLNGNCVGSARITDSNEE